MRTVSPCAQNAGPISSPARLPNIRLASDIASVSGPGNTARQLRRSWHRNEQLLENRWRNLYSRTGRRSQASGSKGRPSKRSSLTPTSTTGSQSRSLPSESGSRRSGLVRWLVNRRASGSSSRVGRTAATSRKGGALGMNRLRFRSGIDTSCTEAV
ncbi:hypothetical protein BJY59DRAFT_97585 [Rhodotorula toruloides]